MRVLLVGDLHGNVAWLRRVVFPAAKRHGVERILQVGDFGWWPGTKRGPEYLDAARSAPVPLWWIDGNHEDHGRLGAAVADHGLAETDIVGLGGNLSYIARGSRFDIGGVSFLGCGGAHSIDRPSRTPGFDWFPAERTSDDDVDRCVRGGHADVLLCHDAPAGWPVPNLPPLSSLPRAWQGELPECHGHRRQLARIVDAVTPTLIVHGHYHSDYRTAIDAAWGPVAVLGLSEDGTGGNLAVLECHHGSWSVDLVLSTLRGS